MTINKVIVETDNGEDVSVDDLPRQVILILQRDGVTPQGQHLGNVKVTITPQRDSNCIEFYIINDLHAGVKVIPQSGNVFSIELPTERS